MRILVVLEADWFDRMPLQSRDFKEVFNYYIAKKLKLPMICNLADDLPDMIVNFLQILGSPGKCDWKCRRLFS